MNRSNDTLGTLCLRMKEREEKGGTWKLGATLTTRRCSGRALKNCLELRNWMFVCEQLLGQKERLELAARQLWTLALDLGHPSGAPHIPANILSLNAGRGWRAGPGTCRPSPWLELAARFMFCLAGLLAEQATRQEYESLQPTPPPHTCHSC